MAGLLEEKMQNRLVMAKRLNKMVEWQTTRGVTVQFFPDGRIEFSRPNSKTMVGLDPLPAWRREVEVFARDAGYSQYDLSFNSEGLAKVTPL